MNLRAGTKSTDITFLVEICVADHIVESLTPAFQPGHEN